jgi:hypothetical protein
MLTTLRFSAGLKLFLFLCQEIALLSDNGLTGRQLLQSGLNTQIPTAFDPLHIEAFV